MKPLTKYIGGKARLAPHIINVLRDTIGLEFGSYVEPFCGGAALFCALHAGGYLKGTKVRLNDDNRHAVDLLLVVRDDPDTLLGGLQDLHALYHDDGDPGALYYEQRDLWNAGDQPPHRYVFLRQTAFNGLWRVNGSGRFNASWGKYANPLLFDPENVMAWHAALGDVEITHGSFVNVDVAENTLVYADPPYVGTFTGYTAEGFGQAHQISLLAKVWQWRSQGAAVAYSNSLRAEPLVSLMWEAGEAHRLTTRYSVNTDGAGRVPVQELLVTSSPTVTEFLEK